jgi:thiol-disulfide isomerase/thioredoxin
MMVACVCLAPAGCASFGKRSGGGDRSGTSTPTATAAADRARAGRPAEPAADPLVGYASAPELSGMLVGRVVDVATGRPVQSYIRLESPDDPKPGQAPVDVEARDGYFTIQGLKPGKQYKLVGRAKQGTQLIAGVTFVTAPDVHILIKLSSAFAGQNIPPLPDPPGLPGDKSADPPKDPKKPEEPKKTAAAERPASAWGPAAGSAAQGDRPPAAIRTPEPLNAGSDPRQAKQPNWGQGAPKPPGNGFVPNIVNIPGPGSAKAIDPAQQKPVAPAPAIPSTNGPPPPWCSLIGKQLQDMALPDLAGGTWQWRVNRRGKLVLLDFWHTNCAYCVADIPNLKLLQADYGYGGLEVVGIACEKEGTPAQQIYRVANLCRLKETNYRLLLAGGGHNPVPVQFEVRAYPTLVLLDETGTIVWRHEGMLQRDDVQLLQREIEARLGVPKRSP